MLIQANILRFAFRDRMEKRIRQSYRRLWGENSDLGLYLMQSIKVWKFLWDKICCFRNNQPYQDYSLWNDDTINATKFSYDRLEVETTFTADVLKRDRASHFDVNGELTVNVMGRIKNSPPIACISYYSSRADNCWRWDGVYQWWG